MLQYILVPYLMYVPAYDTCYLSTIFCPSFFFLSIANLYLVPANFWFLLLSCLNFVLNYFFLSSLGLFELAFFLLWVILNWLFLVLRAVCWGS